MPSELLQPEEINARAMPALGRLTHCYGGIVTLNAGGRVEAKGSFVLVRSAYGHLVFTAGHVADKLRDKSGLILVRPSTVTEEAALRGVELLPLQVPVSAGDIAWRSVDMDVAALYAPAELVSLKHLRWFDGSAAAAAARSVRLLQSGNSTSLLTFIMGSPNFAHFREQNYETISFIPMHAYISSSLEAHSWDGVSRVPQIHLEIDDGSKREQPEQQGFRGRLMERVRDEQAHEPRLGGFSGGPIIVVGNDGEHLIGLVTEGEHVFGVEARAIGVAWDDIVTGLTRDLGGRS